MWKAYAQTRAFVNLMLKTYFCVGCYGMQETKCGNPFIESLWFKSSWLGVRLVGLACIWRWCSCSQSVFKGWLQGYSCRSPLDDHLGWAKTSRAYGQRDFWWFLLTHSFCLENGSFTHLSFRTLKLKLFDLLFWRAVLASPGDSWGSFL